jgi:hypothetical protein
MTVNQKKPTVKIRYVGHGPDYTLVQTIEGILRDQLKWTDIEVDGKNDPVLRPERQWKVIFDYSPIPVLPFSLFGRVAAAFKAGELIGVPIRDREDPYRDDVHHLLIEVLPDGGDK